MEGLLGDYAAAFVRRAVGLSAGATEEVRLPGLCGAVGYADGEPVGRLLVTDDRALDALRQRLPDLGAMFVSVLGDSPACERLMGEAPGYRRDYAGAVMACPDLAVLREQTAPAGLSLRTVSGNGIGGIGVRDAVRAHLKHDEDSLGVSEDWLTGFLTALPNASLFAAVDDDVIHATSGAFVVDGEAMVIFVCTDPAWRGRGVGTWMTATALLAAREVGARSAYLDASTLGEPIYRRLGFERLASVARYAFVQRPV